MSSATPFLTLKIKAFTWVRDSSGLYDYQSHYPNICQCRMEVKTNCYIGIHQSDVRPLSYFDPWEAENTFKAFQKIAAIRFNMDHFEIEHKATDPQDLSERLWTVVDLLKVIFQQEEEHYVKDTDVIKLGKTILEVRIHNFKENERGTVQSGHSSPRTKGTCRICYGTESTIENPLISVCKCSGTLKYTHYKCLTTWLNALAKIKVRPYVKEYKWERFECELCRSPYPNEVDLNDRKYYLLPLSISEPISLTTVSNPSSTSKFLYILMFDKSKPTVKIGRGHGSDLKLPDLSISRVHCTLSLTEKGLFLKDNSSKFGTLVLVNEAGFKIAAQESAILQVNRTVLKLKVL